MSKANEATGPTWVEATGHLVQRTFGCASDTPSGTGQRVVWSTNYVFACFVVASVPAALVGVWHLGHSVLLRADPDNLIPVLGLRAHLLPAAASEAGAWPWWSETLLGLSYMAPQLFVALALCAFWMIVFRRLRGNTADAGWIMTAWLFVLLLPPGVSPGLAALGISFGVLVGAHIFGGTGRYLVSPALLGVLFLQFSYPDAMQAALTLPNADLPTTWMQVMAAPSEPLAIVDFALGRELAAFGTGSALACVLGGLFLVYTGAISWRIPAGALIGLLAVSLLVGWTSEGAAAQLPGYGHLLLGNFAFVAIFIATDPSAAPLTRAGRWCFGGLIGVLTIIIRVLDPSHPEGSLFAVLLAALAVPLIDYLVVRQHMRRRAKLMATI